jgi:FkbM family methyltransferase
MTRLFSRSMSSMADLLRTLHFIVTAPLNKGRRLNALMKYMRWQLGTKLLGHSVIVDWVNDAKFAAKKGEVGLTGNLYCGFAEFTDMSFLLHYLTSDMDFYDVGANVGAYSILASAVRGCRSYAFEPLPDTHDRLVDQIKINRIENLVTAKNCGIGASEELLEFTNTLNCMNKVNTDPNNKNVTKVPVVTLDQAVELKNKSIVKIDVEGYEKFVIEGGKQFFSDEKVEVLIIELNGSGREFGITDEELDVCVRQFGFVAVGYNPFDRSLLKLNGYNEGGNTIYVKDIDLASKRCMESEKFEIHTAGSKCL